ncbi:MAG: adenylate/guanylate cyclase domain-containing protein [Patescibacteria group bacterium]
MKTIVAVDLTDSTSMKEQQSEATWLTQYAWFFDLLFNSIKEYKGTIVKFLGDGAMSVFSEDHVAEAINWSIFIQESMAVAREQNQISCSCSVGVSYGEVIEFDVTEGSKDYIGTVADRAFRLCSAAKSNAVFVDNDTVAAAAMNRISSRLGRNVSPKRKVSDYQGNEEFVTAKGFSRPIGYYEIMWAAQRYGVSTPYITKTSLGQTIVLANTPSKQNDESIKISPRENQSENIEWIMGRISSLKDTYGFISGPGDEDFWFNPDCLFQNGLGIEVDQEVWFIPALSLAKGKSRRATYVIRFGEVLRGRLDTVIKGYGFASCETKDGGTKKFFILLDESIAWSRGMTIDFTIDKNEKGPAGYYPIKIQ